MDNLSAGIGSSSEKKERAYSLLSRIAAFRETVRRLP